MAACLVSHNPLGFGQRVTWEDSAVAPGNHKLTFRNALNTAASNLVLNFLLPDWVKRIPHPKLAHLRLANDELKVSKLYISKVPLFSDGWAHRAICVR